MNIKEERELFEKTMFTDSFMFSTIWHDGEYIDLYTQSMWQSWLASRNREGYVLVPVDPTQDMIEHGYRCGSSSVSVIYKVMINDAQNEI